MFLILPNPNVGAYLTSIKLQIVIKLKKKNTILNNAIQLAFTQSRLIKKEKTEKTVKSSISANKTSDKLQIMCIIIYFSSKS